MIARTPRVQGLIDELYKLAEIEGLHVNEVVHDHFHITGRGYLVNYWPNSKRMTAQVAGLTGVPHCTPWDAIQMALGFGKQTQKHTTLKTIHREPGTLTMRDVTKAPWED